MNYYFPHESKQIILFTIYLFQIKIDSKYIQSECTIINIAISYHTNKTSFLIIILITRIYDFDVYIIPQHDDNQLKFAQIERHQTFPAAR